MRLLTDGRLYQETREALHDVRARLGNPGASGRAADAILEMGGQEQEGNLRLMVSE
ncbi:hypothetical protein D3C83_178640 [compost metagenome]